MLHRINAPLMALLLTATLFAGAARAESTARETENPTPLDTYVYTPDEHYAWELVGTTESNGCKTHVIELTSQQWLTEAEVDKPIWKHWMLVVVPEEVTTDTAMLYIGGGNNDGPTPKRSGANFLRMATAAKSVVVQLGQIPSEPLYFTDEDKKRRTEDSIIAYTWDKYLRTGDSKWLLRLPMTKGAVRAMDAVQEFCASEAGGEVTVNDFVVAGGSKRGWTTWTTGAVDKRVKAIAPIVIDMLNLVPSFVHHWEVYGFWAPAVGDYDDMDLMDWMHTPEYTKMLEIVEPYSYRDRLDIPKLLLNAAGDQFFLPDSSQFYWDDLKEPKLLRYVPNTGHGMGGTDAGDTLQTFFHAIATDKPLPTYAWDFDGADGISVSTEAEGAVAHLWQATNTDSRDFRVDTIGVDAWTSTALEEKDGTFSASVPPAESGHTAFFIELTIPGPGEHPFKFTTPVRFNPDTTAHVYEKPTDPPKGFLSKN